MKNTAGDAEFHGWRPQKHYAAKFKVGEWTIRRWFFRAGLRSRRIGIQTYFHENDVREWVETGRAPRRSLARMAQS